jgi:O-antigen ligase
LHKFAERPILGFGYSSAEDDPGYITGGYHSEYLTALAEQGLVGTIAVLNLFWFLFRCCWKFAFHSARGPQGQWVLWGCLILLIRASVETPGLFGTAQGPADFLAYIFLACVVGRMSAGEDYVTSSRTLQVRSSPHFMRVHDAAQAR